MAIFIKGLVGNKLPLCDKAKCIKIVQIYTPGLAFVITLVLLPILYTCLIEV